MKRQIGGADVAQQHDSARAAHRRRAERLRLLEPDRAVIGRVWLGQQREAGRVLVPGEVAAVDDQAANRGAVAAEILGGRIDDGRRAVLERAERAAVRRCCR